MLSLFLDFFKGYGFQFLFEKIIHFFEITILFKAHNKLISPIRKKENKHPWINTSQHNQSQINNTSHNTAQLIIMTYIIHSNHISLPI